MALSLLRGFGIVLQLIGFYLIINGPYQSVYGGANVPVPGPSLKIATPPPARVVISQRNTQVLLPCRATINNVAVTLIDLTTEVDFYVWYKNGEKIPPGRNDYRIFNNGTLKLPFNEKASGTYRCLANGTEFGVGAVLSTECVVKFAVLKRNTVVTNITVEAGLPLVLDCPVISIPNADITWTFVNKTNSNININKLDANRFFKLQNESLLISSVTESDRGRFKCVAKNVYSPKEKRQFTFTIFVDSPSQNQSKLTGKLLPPLQNQTLFIIPGKAIQLNCASDTKPIEWWFTRHLTGETFKISNNSNEIYVRYALPETHDGVYKCSTTNDFQEFNITVVRPPVLEQNVGSIETSLSASVTLNCNVSGTPKPNITWYHNGIPLQNTYIVYSERSMLRINSFDIDDEGMYQCFARNFGGEVTSYGSLMLRRKKDLATLPKRPENIKCYPINYKKMFVTFDTRSALHMMSVNIVTENPLKWNNTLPKPIEANSSISLSDELPILKPFVIFMRSLVITSVQSVNGITELQTFDVSLLSKPTKCATQGLGVNAIFFPNGVFIWWTQIAGISGKYYIIQFWQNSSYAPTFFDNTIVGSTQLIDMFTSREDIDSNLIKIPIETNIYSGNEMLVRKKKFAKFEAGNSPLNGGISNGITEVKVPGNVTGILIPNANKVVVRVMIVTPENENLEIDVRYVEWKTIENITQHKYLFRADEIESRSVIFEWNPIGTVPCLRACYHTMNINSLIRHTQARLCSDIFNVGKIFTLNKLKPETKYQVEFRDCTHHDSIGSVEVQTRPDNPGPITNYKIISNDGLKVTWDPPINPNGEIFHYVVYWDIKNASFQANVAESERSFKFPNVTENDKFNITIKAFGTGGIGLPQYIDLRTIDNNFFEKENTTSDSTFFGIAVGVVLSFLCMFVFLLIFLWQRTKFKTTRQNGRPTSSPQPVNLPSQTPCSVELHEIQTLIPKKENICRKQNTTLLPNGNGIYYCKPDEDSSEQIQIHNRIQHHPNMDRLEEISPIGLCSSTPKFSRVIIDSNELHSPINKRTNIPSLSSNVSTFKSDINAQDLNFSRNSSSPNLFHNLKVQTNGNTTQYHNGSLKNQLPPCTKHSTIMAANNAKADPISCKKQLNMKNVDSMQYLTGSDRSSSIDDDSHQKLLGTTLDSSTINKLDGTNHASHYNDDNSRDISNITNSTVVDMNDTSYNQSIVQTTAGETKTNPIKKNNWNHRRPIIDPNG